MFITFVMVDQPRSGAIHLARTLQRMRDGSEYQLRGVRGTTGCKKRL
jgi:hypothetical protein